MTCLDCRRHVDEINRLRGIIVEQDQRIIRMHQQTAAHHEEMMRQLDRLNAAQASLVRELNARTM